MVESLPSVKMADPYTLIDREMERKARMSSCGRFRYTLERRWGDGEPVIWVLCNPSLANDVRDDRTTMRTMDFTERTFGKNAMIHLNLFAYVTGEPNKVLDKIPDPVGDLNDKIIQEHIQAYRDAIWVAGWGAAWELFEYRKKTVLNMLVDGGVPLFAMDIATYGDPNHPLFVRKTAQPVPYPPKKYKPGEMTFLAKFYNSRLPVPQ